MNAQTILDDLAARGVHVWAESDRLTLDAPQGVLNNAYLAQIREHKAELLAVLRPRPGTCPHCKELAKLQDKAYDAWWCPGCRSWFDAKGLSLP